MYAALEAGVSRLFRLGGAHAIAALAYGTATVPRVDRIVGPGNAYVAAAKALVSRDCAIDFFAGPSEIAVLSTSGQASVDRRRPHRAGRARSRRARDPDHAEPAPRTGRRARGAGANARRWARATGAGVARRHHRDAHARRGHRSHAATRAGARRLRLRRRRRTTDPGRHGVRRRSTARRPPATTSPAPTTCCRRAAPRPRAAVSAPPTSCACPPSSGSRAAGLRRIAPAGIALAVAEGLRAHADSLRIRTASHAAASRRAVMTYEYEKVLTPSSRPPAAPEREHRRLLAEGDRRAARAHAQRHRVLSGLRRASCRPAPRGWACSPSNWC